MAPAWAVLVAVILLGACRSEAPPKVPAAASSESPFKTSLMVSPTDAGAAPAFTPTFAPTPSLDPRPAATPAATAPRAPLASPAGPAIDPPVPSATPPATEPASFDWQSSWTGLKSQLAQCLRSIPVPASARLSCHVLLRADGSVDNLEVGRFELKGAPADKYLLEDASPRAAACMKGRILGQRWPAGNPGKRSPGFDFIYLKQD